MKILTVARFTVLRMQRSRFVLAGLLTVGVLAGIFFLGVARAPRATGDDLQWPQNLGRIVLWLAAIWIGLQLVHEDSTDGALRSTLTRPVLLIEYVLGKALGGVAALTALALFEAVALTICAVWRGAPFQWEMLLYLPATLPAQACVLTLAMLLAQLGPRFAAGAAMLIARDGLFTDRAIQQWRQFVPDSLVAIATPFGQVLYWLFPPTFTLFDSYGVFIHSEPNPSVYLLAIPYALHYGVLACLLTALLLSRKEL